MAKRVVAVLIVLFATMNVYAQSVLTISSNNTDISEANTQIQLTLNLNDAVDSTLYINIPEKLTAIPIAIQNNGKNLWLKNGVAAKSKAGTVLWTTSKNGLKFNFFPGAIGSGDIVKIDFMAKYRGKQVAEDTILVRKSPASAIMAQVRLNTLKR